MPNGVFALTEETEIILTDNVKPMAREWYKDQSYVYQILRSEKTDPFAPFVQMFDAAVRGNLPVCYWINRLESSRLRYASIVGLRDPIECLEENLDKSNEFFKTFSRALSDGKLDLEEIKLLESKVEPLKRAIEKAEESLRFQRGVLEHTNENRKKAVAKR